MASSLGAGAKSSLTSKLTAAEISLARGSLGTAINQLEAFIKEVEALQRSGRLDNATASRWIETARDIIGTPPTGVLDQQQLVYDGGTSARTLPGYSVWQSFTPSVSGTLTEIDMGFFNDMSGSGQLQILLGDGSAGPVLQTLTVPVLGITQPEVTWNSWVVSVPVTAGSLYTFRFTPNAATLPDPYGVAIGAGNPYTRGVMGLDDPSGSYRTDFDLVFRTFVR